MDKPLIVIVDAYAERAQPLEEELSRDFDCLSTYDAAEALREIRRGRPAAVVIDFPYPTEARRCLSAVLKEDPETSSTPIVAYSTWDFPRTREKAAELGCSTFIARSDGPEAVARAIDELIAVSREPAA